MKSARTREAYDLLQRGALVLSRIEENGVRVDVPYLDAAIKKVRKDVEEGEAKLQQSKVFRRWQKHFGRKTKLDSREQLGKVIFDLLGYESREETKTGKYSTKEASFAHIDLPFVKDYLHVQRLKKLCSTFLEGTRREVVDGFVHPSYHLNIMKTFRSGCTDPNWQNFPIRNRLIGKIIRDSFYPRKGRQFVSLDYRILEVMVATCYHKDPNMVRYVTDPKTDMHRDTAMLVYRLKQEQVSKDSRYCAKNRFVFPQFYGSYYMDCAVALWNSIDAMDLRVRDPEDSDKDAMGVSLKEHLASKGIKELGRCNEEQQPRPGTFEHHVKKIEDKFWTEMFPVYHSWRKAKYKKYLRTGYFHSLDGFTYTGVFKRNEVLNYDIQGSAFHVLLEALCRIDRWLRKHKMKSLLVAECHDQLMGDCPPEEKDDFIGKCVEVMTKDIPRDWPWLIVPLEVEVEVAPVDESWFNMEKVKT